MRLAIALAFLAAFGPSRAAPVAYRLDPEATFVWFEVLHFRTSTLRGRFGPLQGFATFDAAAGTGEVAIEVDTATVDSGMAPFDVRLRRPDLLASEANPNAYFVASRFRFDGGAPAEVRGEFTLRGVSQPLSLIADRFACHAGADGGPEVCGGDFHAEFRRSAFGMTFGLPFVADHVRLLVRVVGVRQ
jgi:polyisoprenoid-binding protein YceI